LFGEERGYGRFACRNRSCEAEEEHLGKLDLLQ
jgi:hypothetical protein